MRVQGGDCCLRSTCEYEVEECDVTGLARSHTDHEVLRGRESLPRRYDVPFA